MALAKPDWCTLETGGFNPNIPDFYQHQNWVPPGKDNPMFGEQSNPNHRPGGSLTLDACGAAPRQPMQPNQARLTRGCWVRGPR